MDLYLAKKAPPLPNVVKTLIVTMLPYAIAIEAIPVIITLVAFAPYLGGLNFYVTIVVVCGLESLGLLHCSWAGNGLMFPHLLVGKGMSPLPYTYTLFLINSVSFLIVVIVVMHISSLPWLFARRRAGWNLILSSCFIFNVLFLLVTLNIVGTFLLTLSLFYCLFQIKEYYT